MKTILLLVLCMMGVSAAHSQDTLRTYIMETGHWQPEKKAWKYDPDLEFTYEEFVFEGLTFKSNLNTYTIKSELLSRRHNISWNAVDQNGKECIVSLSDNKNYFFLVIIYDEMCYRYYYYVQN